MLLLVLAEGGAYWLMARSWAAVRPMPRTAASAYRALVVIDVLVIVATGGYVLLQLSSPPDMGILALGSWTFAVVEFLHYVVVRLSYPVGEWFTRLRERRAPRLVRDLRGSLAP